MTASTWKNALEGKMPADWAEEIDTFEGQINPNINGKKSQFSTEIMFV